MFCRTMPKSNGCLSNPLKALNCIAARFFTQINVLLLLLLKCLKKMQSTQAFWPFLRSWVDELKLINNCKAMIAMSSVVTCTHNDYKTSILISQRNTRSMIILRPSSYILSAVSSRGVRSAKMPEWHARIEIGKPSLSCSNSEPGLIW